MSLFARLKGIKRIAALVAACVTALLLTGCGASVTFYDYTENGVRYNEYELAFDLKVAGEMEKTAATDGDGKKYTVQSYFYELFTDFGYELVGAELTQTEYVARYRKAVVNGSEQNKYGCEVEFESAYTENPFVRTYTLTAPNPFNGVRGAYDEIGPLQSSTPLERIKNGVKARDEYNELVTVFPSLTEAFPYLKDVNPDGLLLNYSRTGSRRMESSGKVVRTSGDNSEYVFSRYFDDAETTVDFKYRRPVPYGWYMTAVCAGAVTLVIFVLVTRTKKQKPTLLDRFPYNPEQYRDYDSDLPSNLY